MATLTTDDYAWCINWIRSKPTHKATLKTSGLSKTQLYDALQAIETFSVGSYGVTPAGTLKSAIDTATGTSTTLAQDKAMWYAWAAWKGEND